MMRLLVLLTLALPRDPTTWSDAESVEVHDLSALTLAEAFRLEGKPALYRVRLLFAFPHRFIVEGPAGMTPGLVMPDPPYAPAVTVEAVLRLEQESPAASQDGSLRPERWGFRLENAKPRSP